MVFETVRRARHRILTNEALRHAAYSASAALASLILLLLLGTQILAWPWLLLLPAITLGAGAYATWRRVPSAYQVAQRVDSHLKLADTLSTALYFSASSPGGDMQRAQWTQAERIAAGVDPRRAIPLRMPRALYGTAALALVAGSLFALRYGLDRRLDLRPPLARVVQDRLGYGESRQMARNRQNPPVREPKRPQDPGFSLDDSRPKSPGELDAAADSALDTVDEPNVDNQAAAKRPEESKSAQSSPATGDQSESERPEGISAKPGDQQSADSRQGQRAGKQGQGENQQASGNPGESSSLLSKFRDAMSSLMNRMRQPSGAQGTQQRAGAQSGQQKGQSGNQGQNGEAGQQRGEGQRADAQDAQPGDESQNAQSTQAGSPGESGQQPATKQPGSGIGRQDGSKDVKLAEQLAAMGKISEIIGKRAANVTGELTVEVENSNHQLRTPYAPREVHHSQAAGEINRDEIPTALQAYVQQYFEQVRKPAAAAGPASHSKRRAEPPKPGL
ncbi:MAG TPA: hypothetical protein VMG35_18465 [Bryobacteraceae bacterium]|nr:hypothetical protein [Bryobacteraceae bacterium]